MNNITIISSKQNRIDPAAIAQLEKLAALPGVVRAAALPDLHPGKTPVGCALVTEGRLYPQVIGGDIGCGMSLFMLDTEKRKLNLAKITEKLEGLKDLSEVAAPASDAELPFAQALGTIGGGNHFAEFQEVYAVQDETLFARYGFDARRLYLLVHSGSRAYGQAVFDRYAHGQEAGFTAGSAEAEAYMAEHERALLWAMQNRRMIAERLLKAAGLRGEVSLLSEASHNFIEETTVGGVPQYIHRKGACAAKERPLVIPGSRGALTYLVMPEKDTALSLWSVAHGAGRKWERSACRGRLEGKYTAKTIVYSKYKSRVICRDTRLLYEEAPEAYKNIDAVIEALRENGLVRVIAAFRPVLTYKA